MDFNKLTEIYAAKKGGIIGAGLGVLLAVLVLILNPFRTAFIVLCAVIGYFIGINILQGKNMFKALIDKIIPPGTYR